MDITEDLKVSDTAVRLYLRMRSLREPGTGLVWMSLPQLQELIGRQHGLTRKALRNLAETGWIEVIPAERPTQATRYVVKEAPAALSTAA